jgi:DNA primase
MEVSEVLDNYGIRYRNTSGNNRVNCPLPDHEDQTASFSINVSNGLWKCHGCDQKGNLITLIALIEGIPIAKARQRANEILGDGYTEVSGSDGGTLSYLPQWARHKHGLDSQIPPWMGK